MKKLILGMAVVCFALTGTHAQIYSEDFESGMPEGYTAENQWKLGMDAAHTSQYFNPMGTGSYYCVNDDALGNNVSGNGRLITSEIDLTNATGGLILQHDAYFVNGDYQGDETAKVLVSEDGGANFTEIRNLEANVPFSAVKADLSPFAGKNIVIAFDYNDGDSWNYGYCVDNISIYESSGPSVKTIAAESFCEVTKVGGESQVRLMIENDGLEEINSVEVELSDGTNVSTSVIDGLAITPFTNHELKQNIVANEGATTYSMKVNKINGQDVSGASAVEVSVFGINPVEGSRVLVEEATGTWCTWCPRGTFYLERYSQCLKDNFVGIAVHNNDPMANAEYDAALGAFPEFSGYPSVVFDKTALMDPSEIGNPTVAKLTQAPVVRVQSGSEYNESTRTLKVSVKASDFASDMSGVKFFAALVEDGVTGTGEGWAQVNAYSGGANGLMGGFELLPSPAPDQVYNHVARALLGGFYGTGETDATVGQEIAFTFPDIQIPAEYNYENMKIVGLLIDADNKVLNAEHISTAEAEERGLFETSTDDIIDPNLAQVFPNPAQEQVNVQLDLMESSEVEVELFDMLGRQVYSNNFGKSIGSAMFMIDTADLNNGLYNLKVRAGKRVLTTKVTIAK